MKGTNAKENFTTVQSFITDSQNNSRPGSLWKGKERFWKKQHPQMSKPRSPKDEDFTHCLFTNKPTNCLETALQLPEQVIGFERKTDSCLATSFIINIISFIQMMHNSESKIFYRKESLKLLHEQLDLFLIFPITTELIPHGLVLPLPYWCLKKKF